MKGAGDWIAAVFLVALVYLLVRPRSAAADAVDLFAKAMTSVVKAVVDLDVSAPKKISRGSGGNDNPGFTPW